LTTIHDTTSYLTEHNKEHNYGKLMNNLKKVSVRASNAIWHRTIESTDALNKNINVYKVSLHVFVLWL